MAKENYVLKKIQASKDEGITIGFGIATQMIRDAQVIALNDPDCNGGLEMTPDIIMEIDSGTVDYMNKMIAAWEMNPEQDWNQDQIDRAIEDALGKKLEKKFRERYPVIRKYDYNKGKFGR